MFVVCDKDDIVQDIATEEANLSRGYGFVGYKLWTDVKEGDIRIGDTFKNGTLIPNEQLRQAQLERQTNEAKIVVKVRRAAIDALILEGQLSPGYE